MGYWDCSRPASQFENVTSREIVGGRESGKGVWKLGLKYFYNDRKMQENIKESIISKSIELQAQSQKNSMDSTETSRRISLHEYYDDELDITVLSSSSDPSDSSPESPTSITDSLYANEEFQILMEETVN
jgi:hypothetical protein